MKNKICAVIVLSIIVLTTACAPGIDSPKTDTTDEHPLENNLNTRDMPAVGIEVAPLPATYSPISSGAQRWEYTSFLLKYDEAAMEEANKLGAEGWELVAVTDYLPGALEKRIWVFKRPLQ